LRSACLAYPRDGAGDGQGHGVGEEFKVGQMPLTSGRPLQKREDRKKLKTTFSWLT
jgi:hypothetical protein